MAGAKTQATTALDKAGIEFSVHGYDHDPASEWYGLEAATALGLDPREVFKTLLVDTGGGMLAVAVIPVDRQLDHDTIYVSGGRRGLDIGLSPGALAKITAATTAPISRT